MQCDAIDMIFRPPYHRRIAQLADAITTFCSFVASYLLWALLKDLYPGLPIGVGFQFDTELLTILVFASLFWVFLFNLQNAYSYQRFTSFATEVKIIFKTELFGLLVLMGAVFMLRPGYIPRTMAIFFVAFNFIFLLVEKYLVFLAARFIRKHGRDPKSILVVGIDHDAKRFADAVHLSPHWGLNIVGFVGNSNEEVGLELCGKKILGTVSYIEEVVHSYPFDEVIVALPIRHIGDIKRILEVCEREGVQARIISDFLGSIVKKLHADIVHGIPIISVSYVHSDELKLFVKRIIDIIGSSLGLIILSPFLFVMVLAVKFTSPGPVFYEWNVMGLNKKPVRSWKFRTMVSDADTIKDQLMAQNEMNGPVFKIKDDPRITKVGKFLRKYSLDELPQLWSVLKGDMSLVGPRPAGPHELRRYESWQRRKLSIKPGITCLWQVNGRNQINDFNEWAKLDLEYIDNWSLWLDFKILVKTVWVVIRGTGC
ncbi:sugar transferase [Thermodesulfobacteriota bacterium]